MNEVFTKTRRVEFCETDAAGIAHFSSFFLYMEQAEHEMLRSLGTSVHIRDEQSVISFPRVSASCDYRGSVRFEEVLTIRIYVERLGKTSVTYKFDFSHEDQSVADGKLTTVCCRIQPNQRPQSITIPQPLADKLQAFTKSESTPE